MANFNIDNVLESLSQSGLAGVTLNDNAPPAANIIYSSLKSGGGGSTPPATTTSLGTIQLSGALTGVATSPQLAAGSVGASQLAPGAVTSSSIAPGSISGASLAPGSITSTQLAPGAVGSSQIANGAVGTMQLAPLSGPSELLGSNSVSPNVTDITLGPSLQMSPFGVLSVNSASVTIPPATTASLGTIQLAGALFGTATSPTISNGAISTAQLAPNAVTQANMAPNSVGTSQLVAGSVGSSQLAANAVGPPQLAPLSGPSELLGSNSSSAAATDISLGTGLVMSSGGVLSVNAASAVPPATSGSLGTIQLAGALIGSATAPTLAASSVGTPQIVAGSVGTAQLGANVVGTGQLAALSGVSELIGSNSTSPSATNITLGSGLSMSAGGVLSSTLGTIPVPVASGGTGLTTITSGDILLGNGTSPITAAATIPASKVTPNLVGSVNGVSPASAGGNVAVLLSNVSTGTLAALPTQPQPSGNIYVVSGDGTPSNNGMTFISTGSAWLEVTNNLASTDARYVQLAGSTMNANADLIFPSTGHVTLNQTTFSATDAVTAAYVASQISAGTPAATTTSLGTIQLAGSLTGTATAPAIASGVITQANMASNSIGASQIITGSVGATQLGPNVVGTGQLAPLGAVSELLGSNSASTAATNISLGSGLAMSAGGVLSVNSATAVPAATSSALGTIQLAGVLSGSATAPSLAASSVGTSQLIAGSVGATQLGANVVGTGQLAALSGPSELIGSNSSSSAATNISLGSGLSMSAGGVLSVNAATAVPAATASSLGTIQLAGSLTGTATAPTLASNSVGSAQIAPLAVGTSQIANGAVGVTQLAANSVGTGQLAALTGPSELLGSNSVSSAAMTITLGTGLSMSAGGVLSASGATPPATASTLGTIQLAGSLSGTATSPTIANNAVGTAQLANNAVTAAQLANGSVGTTQLAALSGPSELIGSTSGSNTASNITLGSGLSMSGAGQLSVNLTGVSIPPATASTLGGIEMLGDLTGSSANAPTVAAGAITLAKMANLAGNSQLIGSNSTSTSPVDITLGPSMSMTASQLNSKVSSFSGTNPNVIAPTDRPATTGVLYYGTDGSTWIWNGTNYVTSSGSPGAFASGNVAAMTAVTLGVVSVRFNSSSSIFEMQCTSPASGTTPAGAMATFMNFRNSTSGASASGGTFNAAKQYNTYIYVDNTSSGNFPANTYAGTQQWYAIDLNTRISYNIICIGPSTSVSTSYITIRTVT